MKYSFIPEGYESEKKEENKVKPSFIPAGYQRVNDNNQLEIKKAVNERDEYVPQLLRDNDLEGDVGFLKRKLFSQGKEGFDTAVRIDKGKVAWALEQFKDINPDVAAKVQEIAKTRKMPFENVVNNKEEWQKWKEARDIYNGLFAVDEEGKNKYPYTANWLARPEKMAMAKDDVAVLTQIEELIYKHNTPFYGKAALNFKEATKDLGRNFVGALQGLQETEINALEYQRDFLKDLLPGSEQVYNLLIADKRMKQAAVKELRTADFLQRDDLPRVGGVEGFALDVIGVAPQMIASTAAALTAGPAIGAGVIGAHIFGGTYTELIDQGVDHDRAMIAATGNATLQTALEYIPLAKLTKAFKSTGITQTIKNFIGVGIAEMGTEFLQAFPEDFSRIWGLAKKEGMSDEQVVDAFVERLPETAKQGLYEGLVVAPFALFGGAVKLPMEFAKQKQLDANKEMWDRELELVQESKLKERAPEEMEEFLKAAHAQGDINEDIGIPIEAVETLYQGKPRELKQFLQDLGVEDQGKDAALTGELKVSRSRFAQKFAGTEIALALQDDIRFDPEGLTVRESAKLKDDLRNFISEAQEEYSAMIEEEKLPEKLVSFRDTLMRSRDEGGLGVKAEDADQVLSVFIAGSKQLSKQRGETVDQWFDRINPIVKVNVNGQETVLSDEMLEQDARGSVEFKDTETVINLFKNADRSTMLHEIGHIYFKELKDIVDNGLGDEQTVKGYETALNFIGGKVDRAGQEKWARAFEAYLREGKAPSVKLAQAFQKFRDWLTAIYKSVRGLDVEINDDIRAVFDRLLASQEEIAEAKEYYNAKKSLQDYVKLPKKQRNKLDKLKKKSEDKAQDLQFRKAMEAYLKAIGGKEALRRLAEKEANDLRVYKAIDEAINLNGLDNNEILDLRGQEAVTNLRKNHKGVVSKRGTTGQSLALLAAEYEYSSEEALLDDIIEAKNKKTYIEERTNEILVERENEIKKELSQGEVVSGDDAYHNEETLPYLIAQAQAISDKIEKEQGRRLQRLEAKIFKDAAEAEIANMPVWKATRTHDFQRAEARFSKRAKDFLAAGDFIKAHEMIKFEAMNHAMVTASIKARDFKRDIDRRYKTTNIKKKLKNIDNDFRNNAIDLISHYRLNTSLQTVERVTPLVSLDENLGALIPQWILDKKLPDNYRSYRDLKVSELRQLNDAIKSINAAGRDTYLSGQESQYKTIEELKDAMVNKMNGLPEIEVPEEYSFFGSKTKTGQLFNTIKGWVADTKKLELISERLDDYTFDKTGAFGPFRELVHSGVLKETKFQDIQQRVFNEAKPHLDVLGQAVERLKKVHNAPNFDIEGVPVTEEMKRRGRTKWDAEKVIAFVFNMGNESNLAALDNAYEFNDAQKAAIENVLTEKEHLAIQGIMDVTDKLFSEIDKVHFNMYNVHLQKIEPRSRMVRTAEGKVISLKGGYYPLMFDHDLNFAAERHKADKDARDADVMKNRSANVVRSTKAEDGFTYARVKGHKLPPRLSFTDVWFGHISDTARYISHAEYLRDFNRLTLNPEWRRKVEDVAGKDVYRSIRDSISYQALPERRRPDGASDKLFDFLRRTSTPAILGLNLSVGVKQRGSQINAIKKIGLKYLIEGYKAVGFKASTLPTSNNEVYQEILKKDPYMRARDGNISREISDFRATLNPLVKKFKIGNREFTWDDVKDWTFFWINMNDRATVMPVWSGAFQKSWDENPNLSEEERTKKAIEYAGSIIRETQPSSLPIDMSRVQRAEGALRLFTSFSTFTMGVYGNQVQKDYRAWKDKKITNAEYFRSIIYDTVLPSMSLAVIGSLLSRGELPEEKELLVEAPLGTAVSWIPLVRDLGSLKYGRSFGESAAFELPKRTVKAYQSTKRSLTKGKDWDRTLWDIGRAGEAAIGVPALNVVKQTKNIYNGITGKKKKKR